MPEENMQSQRSFCLLPGELRNEVYRSSARSRDLALLSACRQTHDEMQSVVEEEVPRRIIISGCWTDNASWHNSGCRRNAERAHDWEVHWTPSSCPPHDALSSISLDRWAALRAESEVQRRRCVVFLEGGLGSVITAADVLAMGSLAGFRTVEFRNAFQDTPGATPGNKNALSGLEMMLEPVLGAGEHGEDADGHYLAFRPVKKMRRSRPSREAHLAYFHYDSWLSAALTGFGLNTKVGELIRLECGEAVV